MPKKNETGGLVSPENLWGKPLQRQASKENDSGVTGMRTDDENDMEEDDINVDDELASADAYAEENDAEDDDATEDSADDELTYAPEDGDDVADEESEEHVASAVDSDTADDSTETAEDAAPKTPESRKSTMPDSKKKLSLSDHVRNEIEKRKASGASLRGVEIVAALEKRGVTVSPAQVSQLLKKAGVGGAPRGRRAAAAVAGEEKSRAAKKGAKKHEVEATVKPRGSHAAPPRSALKAPAKTGNGFRVPMDQLQAAEAFVAACGGSFDAAGRILTAAQQLSQTFGS